MTMRHASTLNVIASSTLRVTLASPSLEGCYFLRAFILPLNMSDTLLQQIKERWITMSNDELIDGPGGQTLQLEAQTGYHIYIQVWDPDDPTIERSNALTNEFHWLGERPQLSLTNDSVIIPNDVDASLVTNSFLISIPSFIVSLLCLLKILNFQMYGS
jgi:hypothetical protein